MTDPTTPQGEPDVRALATFDFSGPEDGHKAFRRIALGIGLLLLGIVIVVGCAVAWIATFLDDDLWDWSDLIMDGAWFVGAVGLGVALIGFTLLQSGRRRRLQTLDAAMTVLDTLDGDPQPETSKRILPPDAPEPTAPPKPLV